MKESIAANGDELTWLVLHAQNPLREQYFHLNDLCIDTEPLVCQEAYHLFQTFALDHELHAHLAHYYVQKVVEVFLM